MTVVNKGEFGAESTASEVLAGVDLSGRLAVVTGGGGGLGRETARALAEAGADVIIAGRSKASLSETCDALKSAYPSSAVYGFDLDLPDLASVERFSDKVLSLDRPVDLLIANAGIMATPLQRTATGWEMQLATNYIGHAVLISQLSPAMRRSNRARAVVLSSSGHHFSSVQLDDLNFEQRPYDPWIAYGQSKTACSLLAVKVSKTMAGAGVSAMAVHPGVIGTGLMRHLTPDDYVALRSRTDLRPTANPVRKSVEQGAATTVFAATRHIPHGNFAYLEDCRVALPIEAPNAASGVLPYAIDPDLAEGLWRVTEAMVQRTLPL